jgi:hypothetical protein
VNARHFALASIASALACGGTAPQTPTPVAPPTAPAAPTGAATITADDVRRRIYLIADDSMAGRGTPSPGLETMAAYVAGEFRRFGLTPAGDSGTYLQHYPLEIYHLHPESSSVWATGRATGRWQLGRDMALGEGQPPNGVLSGRVTLLGGDPQLGGTLDSAAVTGKFVVLALGPNTNAVAIRLIPLRPAAAILPLPDSLWSKVPGLATERVVNPEEPQDALALPPILYVSESAFTPWLARAGANRAALKITGPLTANTISGTTLHLDLVQRLMARVSAPNVVGILQGTDSTLRNEYVLFTGHMDHIGTASGGQGCTAKGGDTICNGADDDGSGSVAVLELAQAFASAPERPRRSLVFMTVSGEERGLWGSAYWAAHPTVALDHVVADLNSDMVGRSDTLKDSVVVIGREHSDLGTTLDRIAAAHPELHMTPVGDRWPQEGLYFRSDHYNFARKGVPILFFTSGLHPDYHEVTDSPDRIDTDKEARFARLIYFLGWEVANARERPRWNPDSYRKIVQGEN